MKFLKKLLVIIVILISIFSFTACESSIGGISITPQDVAIDGTIFDTKNLKIVAGDIKGDINYCIKVVGHTDPVNDSTWARWFGDEESDIYGKLIVCLKLEYSQHVANDPDATITLPISPDSDELASYKISDFSDGENYLYLILNPRHDLLHLTINYMLDSTPKDIKYLIDLMDVNAKVSGALE